MVSREGSTKEARWVCDLVESQWSSQHDHTMRGEGEVRDQGCLKPLKGAGGNAGMENGQVPFLAKFPKQLRVGGGWDDVLVVLLF